MMMVKPIIAVIIMGPIRTIAFTFSPLKFFWCYTLL
jgi:DUF1365 family protein